MPAGENLASVNARTVEDTWRTIVITLSLLRTSESFMALQAAASVTAAARPRLGSSSIKLHKKLSA